MESQILKCSNAQIKWAEKDKNQWNIRNLILSIWMSIFLTITPAKALAQDKQSEWNNSETPSEQITASKSILSLIGKILLSDTKDVSIDKKTINERYAEYIKIKWILWPSLETSLRKFIYERYIDLLSKWYEINWCDELGNLIKILKFLNDKIEIKVTAKKDEPDFKDKIKVVWTFDNEWKFIIKEESSWSSTKKKTSFSSSSLFELISAFEKDIPDSFKQAMLEIAKINGNLLAEKEKLRLALIEISWLKYSLDQANTSITNIKKEMDNAAKKAGEDARIAWENAETAKQNALNDLKIIYDKKIALQELEKQDKDKMYTDLRKEFEDATRKANEDAEKAKNDAKNNLQSELAKLQTQNDVTIAWLQKEIDNLKKEISNKWVLINTISWSVDNEKEKLKAKVEELNATITSLRNQIIDLQSQMKARNEEIITLKKANEWLVQQSTTNAQNSLALKEQQEKVISEKDAEISTLKASNQALITQIQQLEKDKAEAEKVAQKVKEMEQKVADFIANLERIKNLETEIWNMSQQITWLKNTIDWLQQDNSRLKLYETKAQEFDTLKKESDWKSWTITNLEGNIQNLTKTIEELSNRIKSLETELSEAKKREASLIESIRVTDQLKNTVNQGVNKTEKGANNSALISEIERLKKELESKNSNSKELEKRIIELEKTMKAMEKKHKEELEKQRKKFIWI